jgi:integrase
MAHLIRPWVVQYIDKNGKRCSSDTPGATRKKVRARKWYGAGIPGYPPGKRVPLASNRTAAQQMLAKLVEKAERGEAGLEDSTTRGQKTPLATHLEGFEAHLKARGASPQHVALTMQRVRDVFTACNFTLPLDINSEAVENYLHDRRCMPKETGGISIQSSNYYLGAVKQFCRWMARKKRMGTNPMLDVTMGKADLDRRHLRRDLKPEELQLLLDVTRASKREFRGLSGPDRHILYLTACATGLRAGELARLTPEFFDLDGERPAVKLPAKFTKNKKPLDQPIPAAVAELLRAYLADRPAGEPLWPGTWLEKAAKMLRADLAVAGIPYEVPGPDGPLYADFHALRHTYITLLGKVGTGTKDTQALARHSTIMLTLDRYTHEDRAAMTQAVNRLPLPVDSRSVPQPSLNGDRAAEQGTAGQPPTAAELAQAVVFYRGLLEWFLFAPLFALKIGTEADGVTRQETERTGRAADSGQSQVPFRKPA